LEALLSYLGQESLPLCAIASCFFLDFSLFTGFLIVKRLVGHGIGVRDLLGFEVASTVHEPVRLLLGVFFGASAGLERGAGAAERTGSEDAPAFCCEGCDICL
jgi:hypothetical protein